MTEQDFQNEYERGYNVGKYHGFKEGEKVGYQKAQVEVWGNVQQFGDLINQMGEMLKKLTEKGDARGDQDSDRG